MRAMLTTALLMLTTCLPTSAVSAQDANKPKSHDVPYRLTKTQHIMVRVKLNNKGPFNFIIDTGAPALIVNTSVAQKLGMKESQEGTWTEFDRMELEGGLEVPNPKGLVLDMFQLKGMNSMGLAGVELHGVIGYNLLARYRIRYDFTRDKLKFTDLDFDPAEIKRIGGKDSSQGGLELMGDVMKMLSRLMGVKPNFELVPRGQLGIVTEQNDDGHLIVRKVLADTPANAAGLKVGDRIRAVGRRDTDSPSDLSIAVGEIPQGQRVNLKISRDGNNMDIDVKLGKGF